MGKSQLLTVISSCRKFENIYIGWGHKFAVGGFQPALPPMPQKEYPDGPEITEVLDPTVEEELALKEAQEEKRAAQEAAELGLDGDDELEEDEEDDD